MKSLLLEEVENYVVSKFQEKLPKELCYHDILHTREVVEHAYQIGKGENLTEEELEIVAIAAWFHDIGYIEQYVGHEEESQVMADEFLKSKKTHATGR